MMEPLAAPAATKQAQPTARRSNGSAAPASPAVRRFARELGVDLNVASYTVVNPPAVRVTSVPVPAVVGIAIYGADFRLSGWLPPITSN